MHLPPEDRRVMGIFRKKPKEKKTLVQCAPVMTGSSHPFALINSYKPLTDVELDLYSSLREALPIIDAAIGKIIRLMGTFDIMCQSDFTTKRVEEFLKNVNVCNGNTGINNFVFTYLEDLLTYGQAVGEIVLGSDMKNIEALYNANLKDIKLYPKDGPLNFTVCKREMGREEEIPYPELILCSMLNPEAGRTRGTSILRGLPFVSGILLKIFQSIGQNWDRAGNIRFAVTYKPESTTACTQENAQQIADEWSRVMRDKHNTCDFVSVGDISIKTIGADNQILDCDVPVRHITEQIVAKLSMPPFLLGLSWSTTERMSSQQADILTSELEYYRGCLNPALRKIIKMYLNLQGIDEDFDIVWNNINLQDELELSQARLNKANALRIEKEIERDFGVIESENEIIEEV